MDSEEIYAGQLAEGLFLSNGVNALNSGGLLTQITRSDVKQRRPPSLYPDNFFNNAAPSKKKQKLHSQSEGKDAEGSLFDDEFGEKGKDKFLPFDLQPLEATSTELVWSPNSPNINSDDFSFSPFSDFNFDSPTPIQEVTSPHNFDSIVNQSPEGCLTILQNSSSVSTENTESTGTLESSSDVDPLLLQTPTLAVEESNCEAKPVLPLPNYNQEQSNGQLSAFLAPTGSTAVPNDFVLLNTSDTESILVPKHIIEYQDGPYPESKKKQLVAYCSLTDIGKDITAMLNEMAAGPVNVETLRAFVVDELDKLSILMKCIPAEVTAVDKKGPLTPVPISAGPETDKMIVEGYSITLSTWAAAYPHIDIKNAAVDLFEELFTDEEKKTITLSGRVCNKMDGTKGKTQRLDPKRLNVINHAIASMMKKKSTYHYCVDDFKDLKKTDFKAIKEGLSQRVNQIKQAEKKALQNNHVGV